MAEMTVAELLADMTAQRDAAVQALETLKAAQPVAKVWSRNVECSVKGDRCATLTLTKSRAASHGQDGHVKRNAAEWKAFLTAKAERAAAEAANA